MPPADAGTPADAGGDTAPAAVQFSARVTGLVGTGLVLRSAAGEEVAIAADGSIVFSQPLSVLDERTIAVISQPVAPRQTCQAQLQANARVMVSCATNTYALGGTVVGLAGAGLVLKLAGEDLAISASGEFRFSGRLPDLASYAVEVESAPVGPRQTCTVQAGEGKVDGADVSDIQVACTTQRYALSVRVSGLLGSGLAIELAGSEPIAVASDGSYPLASAVADASNYVVTVKTQPHGPDQRCVVAGGQGTLAGADLEVNVICGALGGLRISEVGSCYFANSACWFEVYNAGSAAEELSYYQLRTPSSRREPPYSISGERAFSLPRATIAPGAYLVVQAASSAALAAGQGVVLVADGDNLPWWADSGFVELASAGQTVDFVRFGASAVAPLTDAAWQGGAVPGLPAGANSYGYSLARAGSASDGARVSDWAVRAFATPGGPNDVHSDADVDADGVPDSAEQSGGKFAGLDLYAMGARVGPRDLFVEIDRMTSSDPAVIPQREALERLRSAFAAHNIVLHLDAGDLFTPSFDPKNYNLGGGNSVPFATALTIGGAASGMTDVHDYKATHMATVRRSLFYYMLFGWSQNADGSGGSSGLGERPGNDTIITLGGWGIDASTSARRNLLINYQAATMMHELGHNLGLMHGGGDELNRKPNYVSVMNYLYSPLGLPTIGSAEGDRYYLYRQNCGLFNMSQLTNPPTSDPSQFRVDFSSGLSADLDESSLLESEGLGRNDSVSVDYNCNGQADGPYARDLNDDGQKDVLLDHDDWARLELVFRRSYSGNENGPTLLSRKLTAQRTDVFTHDLQGAGDEPCPAPRWVD